MDLETIIKEMLSLVDKDIKNNPSYKRITKELFKMIKECTNYRIDICEDLYNSLNHKNDKVFIVNDFDTLFYIDCEGNKNISFGINKNNNYSIDFVVTIENEIYSSITTQIIFEKDLTTWKISQEDVNDDGYYYSYLFNVYKYDKNHQLINDTFENELDNDFSKIFNVPLKDAKEYRKNFKKHREYLNKSKKIGVMQKLDELYCGRELLFSEVFLFNDLDDFFIDFSTEMIEEGMKVQYEDDDEEFLIDEETELDEDLTEKYEKALDKLDIIKNNIRKVTGSNGEFTMTNNLCMNITTYLKSKDDILVTKGFIIKKIDNEYTLYLIKINSDKITSMSRPITLEQAREMYNSHEFNKNIYGLQEFFQINRDKTLKL